MVEVFLVVSILVVPVLVIIHKSYVLIVHVDVWVAATAPAHGNAPLAVGTWNNEVLFWDLHLLEGPARLPR